ncbi:beta-ketoacyl synthase N-terminal-like domain-containing protein [Neolewinella sp.]|uniref:beta-ketoacyl synthase N-terminal-like domain-containing protein n=1 Tax=Neolewinella sp. TaxID=2993543 RepID=UPI003B527EFD
MRVGIVGMGTVSAAGADAASSWKTYQRRLRTWAVDQVTGVPIYPVAQLPARPTIDTFTADYAVDRTALLALHAADQAVAAAGWSGRDFSILVGCSRGPTQAWEKGYGTFSREGTVPPRTSPATTLGSIGFVLAEFFGVEQIASSLSVTCSSGLHALLHGVALLRSGMAERVLVGGTEAPLTPFTLEQMRALRVYARVDANTEYACRPLACPSSGMVVGEGAAFLALELVGAAAVVPALEVGFCRETGVSRTGITPTGEGLQRAMRQAIGEGQLPDVVVAHAPGTRQGDAAERAAIGAVFGQRRADPTVTSLKWATGHTFGASGPLGLVAGVQMLKMGRVVGLPYAAAVEEKGDLAPSRVLVNATGFGGNVVSVVVEKNDSQS